MSKRYRIVKSENPSQNTLAEYRWKSYNDRPLPSDGIIISDMSFGLECQTGKIYFFDTDSEDWIEFGDDSAPSDGGNDMVN